MVYCTFCFKREESCKDGLKLQRCSRCAGPDRYCSRECQKDHWKSHKPRCVKDLETIIQYMGIDYIRLVYVEKDGSGTDRFLENAANFLIGCDIPKQLPKDSEFMESTMFIAFGLIDSEPALPEESAKIAIASAEVLLKKAIAINPRHARDAFIEICLLFEKQLRLQEAREMATAAINAQPQGLHWVNMYQRPGFMVPNLKSQAFWSAKQFPWCEKLTSNYTIIKEELLSLLPKKEQWYGVGGAHRESGQQDGSVLAQGTWNEIVLFGRGEQPEKAPKTCELLRKYAPDALDLCSREAGEIIFSVIYPNSIINPHCASTNARLTAHLGLIVPEDGVCDIRVGEERQSWKEGQMLVFDDSFEHEVRNMSQSIRVVLLIRFWHPDVPVANRASVLSSVMVDSERHRFCRSLPPMRKHMAMLQMIFQNRCKLCKCEDIHINATGKYASVECPQCCVNIQCVI